MDVTELTLVVRANDDFNVIDAPLDTTRGVNERGMHDDAPVIDLTEDESFLPAKSQNEIKQEMVNGDSGSDDKANSIPPLCHQSEGDDSSDKEDDDMDKEYSEPGVEPTALRQGTRVRRQAM